MTKHDEIRQILYESGFTFKDGRTALTMTDAEVEAFLVRFMRAMTDLGRQMSKMFQSIAVAAAQATESLRNLEHMLETPSTES